MVFNRKEEMKLGILDSTLGIAVIDSLEDLGHIHTQKIKSVLPKGKQLKDLVFFYMSDRDWIVMNKSHKNYEFYAFLITTYLTLSNEKRKIVRNEAPTEEVKIAIQLLEDILNKRNFIYDNSITKGGVV